MRGSNARGAINSFIYSPPAGGLQLPPGQMSVVDRKGKGLDADVFRCFGCKEAACQVRCYQLLAAL